MNRSTRSRKNWASQRKA